MKSEGLTPLEVAVLAFERGRWNHAGAKEQAIKDLFDLSTTRYYQALNQIIDIPAAYVFDPQLVKRLRALRETRQRTRTAGRLV